MRMWLSRQYDGRFMLTNERPAKRRIRGTDQMALYVPYGDIEGDDIGYDRMCIRTTERLCPDAMLKPLESCRVDVRIDVAD